MDRYYEILGLKRGATQADIKKAYFSLVRQHSPEKDPEKFREIREAYEHLKDAEEEQGPVFAAPSDPFAVRFLKQIESYRQHGSDGLVRDACEEACRLFPDEIQFLYLQAAAQRRAGNTGKAVKSGEELVKKEPDNKWFWMELAIAYQERGYTRKAFCAYDKAYELGCRGEEFILDFSLSCKTYGQFDRGIQVLEELIGKEKKRKREDLPLIMEAYAGIFSIILESGKELDMKKLLGGFTEFLRQYSIYLEENKEMVFQLITVIVLLPCMSGYRIGSDIQEILSVMENACRSTYAKEMIRSLRKMGMERKLCEDPRINKTMELAYEAYFLMDRAETESKTFAMLDVKLCMIEEREETVRQLEVIEKEYPDFYSKLGDFARQLKDGKNLEYLKNSMQKQHARLAQYIDGSVYFQKYPEEKARSLGTVVYQSDDYTPYVRGGKKIGRNEPCPCGSGKKYKHCCMKK